MGQRDQDPKKLKRGTNNKIIDQFWARSNHRNKKMLNITTGKFHPFSSDFFSLPFHASLHVSRPLTEFWHTVSPQPHPHTSKLWEVEWQALHPIQGPKRHGEFDHPCNPTIPSKIDFRFSRWLISFFYDWLVLGGDWCSCAPVLRRQGFTLRLGHVVLILRVLAAHMVIYMVVPTVCGKFYHQSSKHIIQMLHIILKTIQMTRDRVSNSLNTWPHFLSNPSRLPETQGQCICLQQHLVILAGLAATKWDQPTHRFALL